MAKISGRQSAIYYGIANLSQFFSSADVSRDGAVLETTGLGSTDRTYVPGVRGGTVSLAGFYEGSQDATDEKLSNSLATSDGQVVTVMPEGLVLGNRAMLLKARTSRYSVSSPVDGVGTIAGDIQSDGGVVEGHVLRTDAAEITSDGDEVRVDNGAATSEGGVAHLHVLEADDDGGGEIAVMVEHSATGLFAGEQAELVSFAPVAGQPESESVNVAAGTTVRRYLRAAWVVDGGVAPRWKIVVAFGRRK